MIQRPQALRTRAEKLLKNATVQLTTVGHTTYGTAFFISPHHALTADHCVRRHSPETVFLAIPEADREVKLQLRWRRDWSSEQADIAVMELVPDVDGAGLPGSMQPLQAQAPGIQLPEDDLRRLYADKELTSFGYPWGGASMASYLLHARSAFEDPMQHVDEPLCSGGRTLRKRLVTAGDHTRNRGHALHGMSGAPVFIHETCAVTAVMGAVTGNAPQYCAALLSDWVRAVNGRPGIEAVLDYLLPDPYAIPHASLAAIGRGEVGYLLASFDLSLGPCQEPAGTAPGQLELDAAAHEAVTLAGAYTRRFQGKLADCVRENHWTTDCPYGKATFRPRYGAGALPGVATCRAAMAATYFCRLLREVLRADLELDVEFPSPGVLLLLGTDADGNRLQAAGPLRELAEILADNAPRLLFFPEEQRHQMEGVELPPGCQTYPSRNCDEIFEKLLSELFQKDFQDAISRAWRERFAIQMEGVYKAEAAREENQRAARPSAERLQRLLREVKVLQDERRMLEAAVARIRAMEDISARRDALERFWEEFEAVSLVIREEAGLVVVVVPAEEERPEAEATHKLYRSLAFFNHPEADRGENTLPVALAFSTMARYKDDRLYLEGIEGAFAPLRGLAAGGVVLPRAGDWFDRQFELRHRLAKLRERERLARMEAARLTIAELEGEELRLSEEVKRQKAIVDAQWRELAWMSGGKTR